MTSARSCLRELISRAPNFGGWASPELDVKAVADVARELELAFEGGENGPLANERVMELARRFAHEMGCEVFPPVENAPESD